MAGRRWTGAPRGTGGSGAAPAQGRRRKHFVVTGYLVSHRRVLLLFHHKLRRWLPPGGHVEEYEDPWAALVRECREETGLTVRPVAAASRQGRERGVRLLPDPHHVQVEHIDSQHDHVDLVYFCRRAGGRLRRNPESEALRWFSREELNVPPLKPNVRSFARQALGKDASDPVTPTRAGGGGGGAPSSRSDARRPRKLPPR